LNSNSGQFHFVFLLPLFHVENRVCLSRGVQVAGATWCAATSTVAEVGDLVQRTGDGRTGRVLSGQTFEMSGGAVCGLHLAVETRSVGFLVEPQKQVRRFYEWFDLKATRTVFAGLTSKPVAMVSTGLTSKPAVTVFASLASKSVAMVFADLTSKSVATVFSSLTSKLGRFFC
jgi:hypothetical protein